jgi:hypothetical protein
VRRLSQLKHRSAWHAAAFGKLPKSPLALDDLSQLSPWPEILLGLKPFAPKQRTRENVLREYNHDKWGQILQHLKARTDISPAGLLALHGNSRQKIAVSLGDTLYSAARGSVLRAYQDWVIGNLQRFQGQALVELGSGLGEKLLAAARAIRPPAIYGGEFTTSGVECGRLLAKAWRIPGTFGHFDFNKPATLKPIPAGAVVYTAHAIEQIPQLSRTFIDGLIRKNPRVVLHFEPCHNEHEAGGMIHLLRRRYVEVNDYNRNLLTLLRAFEAEGKIRILEYAPRVFGANALNPTSMVVWTPAKL